MTKNGMYLLGVATLLVAPPLAQAAPAPVAFKVSAQMPDALELPAPGAVRLEGFLGARVAVNARNRLATVDLEPLLAGFRKKPGSHPWIGEHIGKWLHAATLAWAHSGEAALRAKLDYAVAELIKAQEPDGYLGTYVPEKRFGLHPGADWDVWSHKYNLLGLLSYYQFTGSPAALQASRNMADLLIQTFGPGKKSILSAGTHVGMAATSVLEPMVILYRYTGQERYLDFAKYLVSAWDEPHGPKILQTLLSERNVQKTANAKAYEMLSNLVGLCELARVTGHRAYVQAALAAWEDVVARRLYATGSASQGEHFKDDHFLPNQDSAHVAETCVTTTWIQLNSQLLRLTGEARFGEELERTFYNHLAAAQHPAGADWCYFTPLEGKKDYRTDINCCHSSGPRGLALAPMHACAKARLEDTDALVVNLFESSRVTLALGNQRVTIQQNSEFPSRGRSVLVFTCDKPATFALQVRPAAWAGSIELSVNGQIAEVIVAREGWITLPPRPWKSGDRVTLSFGLRGRLLAGDHGNQGKAALAWGPFVLAYDSQRNEGLPRPSAIGLIDPTLMLQTPAEDNAAPAFTARVRSSARPEPFDATFVAFAEAGREGGTYRVWLRAPGAALTRNASLLSDGQESRSRPGNVDGSINDGDPSTFVVTFNSRKAEEDWFAVSLDAPVKIARVVFTTGSIFHDGGWFDTSAGKPRLQVQREKGGRWETVGEFADYPATTATDAASLKAGGPRAVTLRLSESVQALAVRVLGKPACGDHANQGFSSCGELEAFAE